MEAPGMTYLCWMGTIFTFPGLPLRAIKKVFFSYIPSGMMTKGKRGRKNRSQLIRLISRNKREERAGVVEGSRVVYILSGALSLYAGCVKSESGGEYRKVSADSLSPIS